MNLVSDTDSGLESPVTPPFLANGGRLKNLSQHEIDLHATLTSDAIYLRGLFIQRYAMIEFALSHLLVLASYHPAYHAFGQLPYRNESKLKRLTQVLEAKGPLQPYAAELREHVDYLTSIEQYRNIIAHAGMMAYPGDDEPVCHFRCFQHIDGIAQLGTWDMKLSQLRALANDIQPHSTAFSGLVGKIGSEVIFSPDQPEWNV